MQTLSAHPAADEHADVNGEGGAVELLERRTTELLGKQAGRFFIKGVTAQLCVLSAYAEARGTRNVLVHPMSRLDDEPETLPWRTTRDALIGLSDPELSPLGSARFPDHRFQPGARSYPGRTGSPLDEPAKTLKAGVHGVPGGENMLRRADGSVERLREEEAQG